MSAKMESDRRDFCSEVALLFHKAMKLGLYRTGHKLHDAVRMVGYEVAGTPDQYYRDAKWRKENTR